MSDELTRRIAMFGALTAPTGNLLTAQSVQPGSITFSPGISIDAKTGKVTIPDGVSLDDASRAFWAAVETMFPFGCKP